VQFGCELSATNSAVRPRAKQSTVIHDRVDVRAPAALKRADGPRFRVTACYELKRDRTHIVLKASLALRRARLVSCCLMIAVLSWVLPVVALPPQPRQSTGERSKALQGEVLLRYRAYIEPVKPRKAAALKCLLTPHHRREPDACLIVVCWAPG
jgi:hypothetical protein